VADLLVFKGAPVDAGNGKGETPLHLAAQMGNTEMCRRLITSKANVNLRARNRWTPLHYAAASGQKDAATLLLEKGADIDASTDSASGTPLYMAASQRHKEVVKLLVDKGADVSASSTDLLYYAAWRGYKELAEACIKKGANVNAKSPGPWGGDAVALYVFYDDGPDSWGDVLELLLAHGADPNANDGSWSLLHYAVYEDISIVRNLLDKGANPNVIDTGGKSPLHYAAEEGRRPAVELLIARGADLNTKDYEGRTPLSLAKEKGHNEIVDLLRKHGAKE
jgi:ankyrin repeat protein